MSKALVLPLLRASFDSSDQLAKSLREELMLSMPIC